MKLLVVNLQWLAQVGEQTDRQTVDVRGWTADIQYIQGIVFVGWLDDWLVS